MTDNKANTVQEFEDLYINVDNVYDYAEAYHTMENYVLSGQKIDNKGFEKLVTVFAKLSPKDDYISFYPINMLMWRKSPPQEQELFDDIKASSYRTDVNSLSQIIKIIDKVNVDFTSRIPDSFIKRYQNFILEKIKTTDFNTKDIEHLKETFADCESHNPKLQQMYQLMPDIIKQTQNEKIGKEIFSLNKWAFEYKNDDLLKKLSYRSTYINILYERLVREHSIKHIDITQQYQNHRIKMNRKVKELTGTTDSKGKEICRKYAINKIYKATANSDNFKLDCVKNALKKYVDTPFYDDCQDILQAIDGGEKSRNVKMPIKFPYHRH
ncbi:MAG: hypothetical protein J6K16_05200 [Alphaproteobacteria bacterium]|nr:hypothetical protein [Alphaproteobacteria bacterium]